MCEGSLTNEMGQRAAFMRLCWISESSMENTTNLHIETSYYYLVHYDIAILLDDGDIPAIILSSPVCY